MLASSITTKDICCTIGIGCAISCVVLFLYKKKSYSFLKSHGYDGPTPQFKTFGNLVDFCSTENSIKQDKKIHHHSKTLYRWSRKYGKIYGYYEAFSPVIVISDVSLVDDIFVKQDANLQYRRSYPMTNSANAKDAHMFLNNGERWLRVRKCLEKVLLNKENVQHFLKNFDDILGYNIFVKCLKKNGVKENLLSLTKGMIAEFVFKSLFGMDLKKYYDYLGAKTKTTQNFVKDMDTAFLSYQKPTFLKIAGMLLHNTGLFKHTLYKTQECLESLTNNQDEDPQKWFFTNYTSKQWTILSEDKFSLKDFNIFESLLSMVNLKCDGDVTKKQFLTLQEAFSNTFLLFFGSYETTATTLQYVCLVLSRCSDERVKLKEEIENFHRENGKKEITIDCIDKLRYVDFFVKEVLRMFPIANSMVSRQCVQSDFYIGENKEYFIPKNANISVDVLSIHYDKDIWGPVDPFIFYPERFETQRHPAAWLPFGVGRRRCLGAKFSLNAIKLFIVRLLENFEVISNEKLESFNHINIFNSIETQEMLFNLPIDTIEINLIPKVLN